MGGFLRAYDCDLHYHGPNSGGVSKNMLIPVIAEQAALKGLQVLSTADILHAKWYEHVKHETEETSSGLLKAKNSEVYFIVGTEVECSAHVHHLIYLPDLASAAVLKEKLKGKASFDGWGCGRPKMRMSAEEMAHAVEDASGIIGPAHAFTPYFSVYAHFNSIAECYKSMAGDVYFMELGLSADSYFADLIPDNWNYRFATFSDAHSPWPYRLGREFTRIRMRKPSFSELKHALKERDEALVELNVGLDPREGKYHCTACSICHEKFAMQQAERMKWRCAKCGGTIKKGVRDRILELSQGSTEEHHPKFRPHYLHILPLAEIIQSALGVEGPHTNAVQSLWRDFVERFKSEIAVLIDAPIGEVAEVHADVAKKLEAFRKGFVLYIPGGGGEYGKPIICDSREEFERKEKELKGELNGTGKFRGQKTLGEF